MTWKTNVLVIANQTAESAELIDAMRARAERGPTVFMLLLPRSGTGHEAAALALEDALERMRQADLAVSGMVGDRDPVVAVREAWDPSRFDEVIVSTLPTHSSRWLMIDLPHRVAKLTGATVTHVVARVRELAPR